MARMRNTKTQPDRTAVFSVHYCSMTQGNTCSSKACHMFKLCQYCGFLWCLKTVEWVAGVFYFLWVKWSQALGYSAMRAICEQVNKSSMGEPKMWSWGLYSQWLLCKARADENWGEEHQPWGLCRAGRCIGPGPRAFSHWASTDLLPSGVRGQDPVWSLSCVQTPGLLGQTLCSISKYYTCPKRPFTLELLSETSGSILCEWEKYSTNPVKAQSYHPGWLLDLGKTCNNEEIMNENRHHSKASSFLKKIINLIHLLEKRKEGIKIHFMFTYDLIKLIHGI